MRLELIDPGSTYSTYDVYAGYRDAWRAQGHEVVEYALSKRIPAARRWLMYQWRTCKKPEHMPTEADVAYLAAFESVIKALNGNVDWIVLFSALQFHPGVLHAIRKAGLKVATILTESPYWDNWQAAWAQLSTVAFCNERTSVDVLKEWQPLTYYLPHAYDPAKHSPGRNGDHPDVPAHDVVFVGTDFPERVETLRAVDWDGIDLGLYGMWHSMGSRNKLRRWLHTGIVDNRMTAALYRHAKIGLNMHRQSADWSKDKPLITSAESLNPRAVELAANGVFTISDRRAEVEEVFGDVVPTYATPRELEGLVRHYLAHPLERADKAAQLPAMVADRTFAALGARVLTTLEEYSGST